MHPALKATLFKGGGAWSPTLSRLRTWIAANKNTGPHARAAMSSPPAVTAYSTKDTAYSVSSRAVIFSGAWIINPAFPGLVWGGVPTNYGNIAIRAMAVTNASGVRTQTCARVAFNINVADGIEVEVLQAASYRFSLNGQFVSFTETTAPSGANAQYIKLAGALSGELVVEVSATNGGVMAVHVKPGDTVTKPTYAGPRMIVQGDSFIGGAGGILASSTIAYVLADYLGIKDVWQSGWGGRSFTGATYPFPAVISDVTANGPWDLTVMAGGFNDKGVADATVLAAAQGHYRDIRAADLATYILAIGPWDDDAPSAPDSGQVAVNNVLKTFLPMSGSTYQDKTGIAYTKVDAIHPDVPGYLLLGAGAALSSSLG